MLKNLAKILETFLSLKLSNILQLYYFLPRINLYRNTDANDYEKIQGATQKSCMELTDFLNLTSLFASI